MKKSTKLICTIGPSSATESILSQLKSKDVDFVRINLSHTYEHEIEEKINMLKPYGIPIIIDTEGPQVRTGNLGDIQFNKGEIVKVHSQKVECSNNDLFLTPLRIVTSLRKGDMISLAFGSTTFEVIEEDCGSGYVKCKVLLAGEVGGRKAVHIESPNFILHDFSEKDLKAIEIAKRHGIKHFTLSFMEGGGSVRRIREFYPESVLYSKIESKKGLENFEEILEYSDGILIDRGDLSSQVSIHKIPIIQKNIIAQCKKKNKEIFVATDTLQHMFSNLRPNAADANDMVNTLLDGATGIALTKETAVGKYPLETIEMMNKIIRYVDYVNNFEDIYHKSILEDFTKAEKNFNAKVLWFTGLSGSGKTTLADNLKLELERKDKSVKIIDGDVVRETLHKHLGFSEEDIKENNRLIAELCKKEQKNYDYILVPIISPYKESRENARNLLRDSFVEVYINCSLEGCKNRDVKGLYQKISKGELKNFIGVHTPYEAPENPEIIIDTENLSIQNSLTLLLSLLGLDKEIF
jgi:pyruvate kinase